ncbi:MAG: radical SAM protein [Candidatus Eisenbacteria bacterium]|nr:radical SAM protein [Candidatus Eisenbacteria bacterium]
MAGIAVITVNDRCCMGARQLSSLVKDRHAFHLICYGEYDHSRFGYTAEPGHAADERLLLDLIARLRPDLIGFSYRSVQGELVMHLAGLLRERFDIPILMGGIGATSDPEEAMERAEAVCIGEADFVLPRLLDLMDERGSLAAAAPDVPNLWHRSGGEIVRNPLERLVTKEELSDLPYIDYAPDNKYSIVRGELKENDGRYDNDVGAYPMLTSRGCPFACTYCHNSNVHDLYRGQRYCRQRSVESVIGEMERAKAVPGTTMISIYDDLFNFNREWTLEFARQYKEKIGLPFWCYTYPSRVLKDVMEALVDAGLNNTAMGVQSGSERTLFEVFNRKTPRAKILEAASVLKGLKCRVQIDLITANNFETDDDRRETLDLMLRMEKNTRFNGPDRAWYYCQSRLTYFPHSTITHMAVERGLTDPFDPDYASFWEMLNELAFYDPIPRSAVMALSYRYEAYRASAKDFRTETGALWIMKNVLHKPIRELSALFDGDENALREKAGGWVPSPEEVNLDEIRTLLDGALAASGEGDPEKRGERIMLARNLLGRLTPEVRSLRLKEELIERSDLVLRLADDIGRRSEERIKLWREVEQRGKWALDLDRTVKERDRSVEELQKELKARGEWALGLDRALKERDRIIASLRAELRRVGNGSSLSAEESPGIHTASSPEERVRWETELFGLVRERERMIRTLREGPPPGETSEGLQARIRERESRIVELNARLEALPVI